MFLHKKNHPIVIVVLTCSQCCTMLCFFFRGEDDAKPRIYHCLLSLGALSLLILPGSDIKPGAQEMGGQGRQLPTQILADQLTLYQPEGADCVPTHLPFQLSVASYAPADDNYNRDPQKCHIWLQGFRLNYTSLDYPEIYLNVKIYIFYLIVQYVIFFHITSI